jgi:zinc transporter 1/2/3
MGDLNDLTFKGLAILLLVASACLGGLVALRVGGPGGRWRRWAEAANCAAGGFLLGAGLFHFLPESHHHFETLWPNHIFPYGFTACAVGFTGILILERMSFNPEARLVEAGAKGSSALILTIALSIHAILSGLAIGAEATGLSLLAVTGALAVHKFAASFTLGSSLTGAGIPVGRFWQVILAFSVSTPIGILIGGGVDYVLGPRATTLIEGVFDGLAAGTFIYIAALDVLHDGFFHRRASWIDMGLFATAMAVMLLLSLAA